MTGSDTAVWEALTRRYDLDAQSEWHKLLEHFDLAEGFAFVVLLVPDADGAALCRHELEEHLQRQGHTLRALEFASPDDLRRLPEHFLEESCDENTACLWIAAVAPDYAKDYAAWREAWEWTLARLNAFRNPIRERFDCTLVFVGAPWLQEVLREIAPDLWSVRTLVVRIEPAARTDSDAVASTQRTESASATADDAPDPYFALEQAEKLRGVPGKELALADLLHRAGEGFSARENWQKAEKAYAEALELKLRHTDLLVTLNDLSWTHQLRGQPQRSLTLAEQALAMAREISDRPAQGRALRYLGNAYEDLGEMQRAIQYHEQSLAIAREIGDRREEGAALNDLGNAYRDLGEAQRSIEFYKQALAIAGEIGDRRVESVTLGNLGISYHDMGEIRRSIEFYEQSLAIAREIDYRRGEGDELWNMSLSLDKLGERARAITLAEAALAIYEQIEEPSAAKVRQQLEGWRRTAE